MLRSKLTLSRVPGCFLLIPDCILNGLIPELEIVIRLILKLHIRVVLCGLLDMSPKRCQAILSVTGLTFCLKA